MLIDFPRIDGWNREATPMAKGDFGVWELTLQARDGQPVIPHNSKVKVISRFVRTV